MSRNAEFGRLIASLREAQERSIPVYVHLEGELGMGKSALLRCFADYCFDVGVECVEVDCHNEAEWRAVLARTERSQAAVYLFDNFESGSLAASAITDALARPRREPIVVVLAARKSASERLRRLGTRPLRLGQLPSEELRAYLSQYRIPFERHDAICFATEGVPYLVHLYLTRISRGHRDARTLRNQLDAIAAQDLAEKLCRCAGSDVQAASLAALAFSHHTTTETLSSALRLEHAEIREIWHWLQTLNFVERAQLGLVPHAVARRALVYYFRHDQPSRVVQIVERLRVYYNDCLASGLDRERWVFERLFLLRNLDEYSPFFPPSSLDRPVFTDAARPSDRDAIAAMVQRYHGVQSRDICLRWFEAFPRAFSVLRSVVSDEIEGFIAALDVFDFDLAAWAEVDPAVRVVSDYLRAKDKAQRVPGSHVPVFRFWLTWQSGHQPGPLMSQLLSRMAAMLMATSSIPFHFGVSYDPRTWDALGEAAKFSPEKAGAFECDGRQYQVSAHDWTERKVRDILLELSENAPEPAVQADTENADFQTIVNERLDAMCSKHRVSDKERSVLKLVILGRSAKEIGAELGIAERTAKYHQANGLKKLGAESRMDIFRVLM